MHIELVAEIVHRNTTILRHESAARRCASRLSMLADRHAAEPSVAPLPA